MIKWTVKDCIEHLEQLKNPFEQTVTLQKPKLSDVISSMGNQEVLNAEEPPKL